MEQVKKPQGRPRKTVENTLKDGWKDLVIEEMSSGAGIVEIRAKLGISKDLHFRWLKDEPVYSSTIKKGEELCEAWWQEQGRKNIDNKTFNAVLWMMNMSNRFGWSSTRNQTTLASDPENPVRIVEIKEKK